MQKTRAKSGLWGNRYLQNISHQLAQVSYYVYFALRELGAESPLVVYQMGKVGSTTITETLKKLSLKRPIYHVHLLTDDGLRLEELKAANSRHLSIRRGQYWTGRYLQRQLRGDVPNGKQWHVITLTRDPIARNLSAFFHLMAAAHPDLYARLAAADDHQLFPEIKENFLKDFLHKAPLEWFDVEMKPVFDIDVYEWPFPWDKGYTIIQHGNVRLLILRLEELKPRILEAFEEWLERPLDGLEIVSANRAEQKPYLHHYRAFQEWLTLPDAYVNQMYGSKFARHFYSPDELQRFRKKWAG